MDRIFYYSEDRIIVYIRIAGKFKKDKIFNIGAEGLSAFEDYVFASENYLSIIILDSKEEMFYQEVIPEVSEKDGQSIIHRCIKQRHPESDDWFYYRRSVLSTSNGESIFAYSIQSRASSIRKWTDIIKEREVHVKCILAAPMLDEHLINIIDNKSIYSLLITQGHDGLFRFSFFIKGVLSFSRCISVVKHDISMIYDEVMDVRMYLGNQGYIGHDELLDVFIITNDKESTYDTFHLNANEHICFRYINTDHILCEDDKVSDCRIINLYIKLCNKHKLACNHYGPSSMYLYWHRYRCSKAINSVSLLMAMIFVFGLYAAINEIYMEHKRINSIEDNVIKAESLFREKIDPVKQDIIGYMHIKTANKFYMNMDKSRKVDFLQAMEMMSHLVSRKDIHDFSLVSIIWDKVSGINNPGLIDYTSDKYFHKIRFQGYIDRKHESSSNISIKISRFVDNLKSKNNIVSVELKRIPMDLRSNKKNHIDVISEHGADNNNILDISMIVDLSKS